MRYFRFNASEMWIILLITAGQNRISAAARLSPLHFYTSPLLGTSQKGSWFSCGLSFVLAAGVLNLWGSDRECERPLGLQGPGWGGFLPYSWGFFPLLCSEGVCRLASVGRVVLVSGLSENSPCWDLQVSSAAGFMVPRSVLLCVEAHRHPEG